MRQTNRLAPVEFTLVNPVYRRSAMLAAQAKRRLDRAEYMGEALMKEYLSLLVQRDDFEDNARPGFLVNPQILRDFD